MEDKYLLFAGQRFYPQGGFHDFLGEFDSIDQAKIHAQNICGEENWYEAWAHIIYRNKIILWGNAKDYDVIEWRDVDDPS